MHIKQKKTLYKTFLLIFTLLLFPITVLATELDSPNYKIVGVTTQGGGIIESTSGNYSALLNVGSISANPRLYSTSYGLSTSPETPFLPAIPTISCFETDTNGSSACTTGPAALTTGGMVAICGPSGCYNKARFEVSDTSASNPADTLYAVMISTDNFVSDIRYIDASTFMPESYSTHNINDFMTKADWEAETFNIKGLDSNTTYYIKAFALKGDFTQTAAGPIKSVKTASGSVYFDIDIAGSTGYTAETSAPYTIAFTGAYELIGGAAAITAGNRIWMDVQTNSDGGFAIVMNGVNGGLRSPTTTQTITSANANLDQVASGFGLQSEYIDYDSSSSLFGTISATADYSGTINTVGKITTSANKVYDGDGPIVDGRMALKVIAKPGITYTPATDYQETIYLIFVPRY